LTIAVGTGVLAALVVGPAAWFLVPHAKYKAQAVLRVAALPPKVLFGTVATQGLNGGEEYARYQKTQMAYIKSRPVLTSALSGKRFRMLSEQPDPVTWLQENLDVHFEAGTELLNICLSSDDPSELADVVNAVKDAYYEDVVMVEHKSRTTRLDDLRKLKDSYGDMMKSHRQNLKKLAEAVGSDDRQTVALKQQFALEHLEAINKERLGIQSQKRRMEAELKMQQLANHPESAAPSISEAEVDRAIEQYPSIIDLRRQLADMDRRLGTETAHTRTVARKPVSDPIIKNMRGQVEALKTSLKRERLNLRPIVLRQLQNQDGGVRDSRGDELQRDLDVVNELDQRLTAELQHLKEGNHSLTVNTLELQTTQDDLLQTQDSAAKIGREVEALTVEQQAPPRVNKFDPAVVPTYRDDKRRFVMIGLITLGSFLAGLFGVALLELRNQKVDTTDEVSLDVGLPIIGALPLVPTKSRRGGSSALEAKDRYWHHHLLESVDATRTMLLHTARSSGYRVVMIGSAESGEGKTTLASHLATSLARTGLKTLLIDGDLRCPTIAQLFDLPPEPGLSELLRGELELDAVIAPTPINDLKVMVAGKFDDVTIRALAQGGLGPTFSQIKEKFDFVIVDSSPLLPVADALMIAQQADAVLFSVLRDVSCKAKVFAAYQQLSRLGVPILGAVVTGAFGGGYGYSGSGYGYYGRPYGYGRPVPGRE
jgi:capsular exopolysaccharide synthesis family protein